MRNALQRLAEHPRFGSGVGFSRCQALLDRFRIDPTAIRTVGVTGSNGKGSTSAMIGALLASAGIRTGVYTSPHFLDPCERYRIDGVLISPETLGSLAEEVLDASAAVATQLGERFARFELLTVMAWLYFQREHVEVAVLEAGIGGRFDTTRLARPAITAITSLDLEHRELLGNTLELIFADKLDLARHGGICFASLPADPVLRAHCKAFAVLGTVHLKLLEERWPDLRYIRRGAESLLQLERDAEPIVLPLIGEWQARNAAIAIAVAHEIVGAPDELNRWCERAFSSVRVPGRFETVNDNPRVIVDAAHTPDAIESVIAELQGDGAGTAYPNPVVLVGISANKPLEQMIKSIARLRAPVFVSASDHGGAMPSLLAELFGNQEVTVCAAETSLATALHGAVAMAEARQGTLFVLGGLFFAADVARLLRGIPTEDAVYL